MRVWTYVITTDRGSAPNYDGDVVTLTICKPLIRKNARPGDLVIAFNGRALRHPNPNSLRWAGVIEKVVPLENYWDDPEFGGKRPGRSSTPDNIYRWTGISWEQEPNDSHVLRDLPRDTGGLNALAFREAWHFGEDGPELYEAELWMTGGRRGHRVHDIDEDRGSNLVKWLAKQNRGLPSERKGSACRPRKLTGKRDATQGPRCR